MTFCIFFNAFGFMLASMSEVKENGGTNLLGSPVFVIHDLLNVKARIQ